MKRIIYPLFIAAALSSCNSITDPAPADPLVPSEIMQVVESAYENPQNVVFTEILDRKIWNAQLESRAKKYNLILSPKNIKVAYRLGETDVPDSLENLINKSAVTGGTFSNWMEEVYNISPDTIFNYTSNHWANYTWKGAAYSLKWSSAIWSQRVAYDILMLPGIANFTTLESGDLPDAITQYLQQKGLQFSWADVIVNAQSENLYEVYINVDKAYYALLFDQNAKLIAGSNKPRWLYDTREYPQNVIDYVKKGNADNDFGFETKIERVVINEMDGMKSYNVILNEVNEAPDRSEIWSITFDANGNPLLRSYLSRIY